MKKKNKRYFIIGGGLYGCLLSYFLKKKGLNVILVEKTDCLFSAFKPVNINKLRINNGFHGLEYPRAENLIQFLNKKIKIKLDRKLNNRKILIGDCLLDSNTKFVDMPNKIKNIYRIKNLRNYKNQNIDFFFKKNFLKKIKKNLEKFSDDNKISKRFILPWFLPSDVINITKDEGMLFRQKVKRGQVTPNYFYPKSGLFFDFNKNFYNVLKKNNVDIRFKSFIKFYKNKIILNSNQKNEALDFKNNIFINCTSSVFMLQNFKNNFLKSLTNNKRFFFNILLRIKKNEITSDFSEVLCLNYKVPVLNRLSIAHHLDNKKYRYLQLECISKRNYMSLIEKREIIKQLVKLFSLSYCKLEGSVQSRVVYYQSDKWVKSASKINNKFLKKNKIKILNRNFFSPVNMTKSWNWSQEDIKKLKIK